MKLNDFPEIETERLLLRRLRPSDWKVVSFLRSDKLVNAFVKRPAAETKEKALAFISAANIGVDQGQLFQWAITEKEKGEMIGSICLWSFSKDKKTAEVGYDLSPKFQGLGLMDEALKSLLSFGFSQLNLDLIEAFTQRNNVRSVKVLERNGFELNGDRKDDENAENLVYEISNPLRNNRDDLVRT